MDERLFWGKVRIGTPEDCWIWIGKKHNGAEKRTRYGSTIQEGKKMLSHRVAWTLANGNIPDGLDVLHKCDNPPCCNPSHLFIGTARDNARDAISKGRYKLPKASQKLSENDVEQLRNDYYNDKNTIRELAGRYGISIGHTFSVAFGKFRKNSPGKISIRTLKKFSKEEIYSIICEYESKSLNQPQLAKKYGATQSCISKLIKRNANYKSK